jgi:hypothetical protein
METSPGSTIQLGWASARQGVPAIHGQFRPEVCARKRSGDWEVQRRCLSYGVHAEFRAVCGLSDRLLSWVGHLASVAWNRNKASQVYSIDTLTESLKLGV